MDSTKVANLSNKLSSFTKYRIACRLIYQYTTDISHSQQDILDILLEISNQSVRMSQEDNTEKRQEAFWQLQENIRKIIKACDQMSDTAHDTTTRTGLLHGFTESDVNEIMTETIAEMKDEGHNEFTDEVFQQVNTRTEDKIRKEIDNNIISLKRK